MRDRLIELLSGKSIDQPCDVEYVADFLLAKGVIVPPCKAGDITYIFDYEMNNHLEVKFRGIAPSVGEAIVIESEGMWIENEHAKYHISSVGVLIFLTREEAEKALERREHGT